MLTIRAEQMQVFTAYAESMFAYEMMEHLKLYAPRISEVIHESELRRIVERDIQRARRYNLTRRGPISLFLRLALILGSEFDTDPQLWWAAEALTDPSLETDIFRAQVLQDRFAQYAERVIGPHNQYLNEALRRLKVIDVTEGIEDEWSTTKGLAFLARLYPEKVAFIGEEIANGLVDSAAMEAKKNGLHGRCGVNVLAGMKIVFGQGICEDPYYPCLVTALTNPLFADGGDRLKQVVFRIGEIHF